MRQRLGDGSSRRMPSVRDDDRDWRGDIIEDVVSENANPNGANVRRKARDRTPLMDRRWR
jgi:hypothetical protein